MFKKINLSVVGQHSSLQLLLLALPILLFSCGPANNQEGADQTTQPDTEKEIQDTVASSEYEIFKSKHDTNATNYYVLIRFDDINEDRIKRFVTDFRSENCADQKCNIHIYDTKELLHLISKYPLEESEYIEVADHYIAKSTHDAPNSVEMYPYQNIPYKEFNNR